MTHNLTEKMDNGKIKVIREFGDKGSMFVVCFGDNWHKGLNEGYKEFNCFNDAYSYFNGIK